MYMSEVLNSMSVAVDVSRRSKKPGPLALDEGLVRFFGRLAAAESTRSSPRIPFRTSSIRADAQPRS
jgi:hypothetical protein